MNSIIVRTLVSRFKCLEKPLRRSAEAIFKTLKKNGVVLDIFLVSDSRMRALNKRWRGKNRTTNVLSFGEPKSFPHPEFKRRDTGYSIQDAGVKYLGELYLAPDYIRKHREDVCFIILHGMLHLLGYTHDGKRDTMKMERIENKLMNAKIKIQKSK